MSENEQDRGPVLPGLTIQTTARAAQPKVDRAIGDVFGPGWHAINYGDRRNQFEVISEEGALSAREAWDRTYQLRAHKGHHERHPDTGYRRHPEIAANLLIGLGRDLF